MGDTTVSFAANGEPRKNKRPRAIQACEFCRAKKYKCSGTRPCQHCEKHQVDCIFEAAETNAAGLYPASYVRALEERIEKLNAATALTQFSPSTTIPANTGDEHGINGHNMGTYRQVSDVPGEHTDASTPEVADINRHTQGLEFHGSSSTVAFLGSIQERVRGGRHQRSQAPVQDMSLINTLHNTGFSPQDAFPDTNKESKSHEMDKAFFSPRASIFLDAYFSNQHFIHPMIDKESIYRKSEELWKTFPNHQPGSFVNLYLALIAMGALIRTWNEDSVMGMRRFDWSRNAFRRAASNLQSAGIRNDIETIQTYFIMAKVCQNELNPSLAYVYNGLAIRLALSAGINRETRKQEVDAKRRGTTTESKTWWGIYSFEIELSFSLGRPDTLGSDLYHNIPMPPVDDSATAIIPVMVDFARITRSVALEIYLSRQSAQDKLYRAFQIENDMIAWLNHLPDGIRPRLPGNNTQINRLRDPLYARLQRMVLQIRFYNVTMLSMRPFLLYSSQHDGDSVTNLPLAITKCITAAAQTIELIHDNYLSQIFFRTWWYNTTYCLFAASIILFALTQPPMEDFPPATLNDLIERSIDVLEAMTECVVAQKAAEMIKMTLAQVREGQQSNVAFDFIPKSLPVSPRIPAETGMFDFNDDFSQLLGSGGYDMNYDFIAYGAPSNVMFWPSLSNGMGPT